MERNLRLRAEADRALAAAPQQKNLALISFGITAGISLLASLLSFLLDSGIAQTGGLSGMGMRSLLATGQSLLSLAVSLLLPFWRAGYAAAMLRIGKEENPDASALLTGFRHFFPLLRLQILTWLLVFAALFACSQVSSILFMFTPMAESFYLQMAPLMESAADLTALDAAAQQQLLSMSLPLFCIMAVLALAVLIPGSYFLRFSTLRLLDAPEQGARAALLTGFRLMRGNCLRLLRMDLHFWWFYLAQGLLVALSFGDYLLPALGIALPISEAAVFFLFYGASLLGEFALFVFCRNRVEVSYARFYLDLLPKEEEDANHGAVL